MEMDIALLKNLVKMMIFEFNDEIEVDNDEDK